MRRKPAASTASTATHLQNPTNLHKGEWTTFSKTELKGSVKEPNKFHNYETEKITLKASDAAEYIELFGSSTEIITHDAFNVIH